MTDEPAPKITAAQFVELLRSTAPLFDVWPIQVLGLGWGTASLRLPFHPAQLRAGGTLSGPTLMTLADTALYAAVLSRVGLEPLAVTSEFAMHFLCKPPPAALVAEATLLRLGRRSAVGEVRIRSEAARDLVAHATGTYALPVDAASGA